MKIAILTEGVSEFTSIPKLIPQLTTRTQNVILKPLLLSVSPDAPAKVIARECSSRLKIAIAKGATKAIILLDRETANECPDLIATAIAEAIATYGFNIEVAVVLKDRSYENWLLADLGALRALPKRFHVTGGAAGKVEPNKSDSCDGLAIMKAAVINGDYDKVQDAVRICARMDLGVAAKHSRSLRHFLHQLGDHAYLKQCKVP